MKELLKFHTWFNNESYEQKNILIWYPPYIDVKWNITLIQVKLYLDPLTKVLSSNIIDGKNIDETSLKMVSQILRQRLIIHNSISHQ